mgnify:FL=1
MRIKQESKIWDIRLDDLVEVNKGPEEGKRGRVQSVNLRYNEVVVEGINEVVKEEMDGESSPFDYQPKFVTSTTPQPIYFRDVSLVDPTLDQRTDVSWVPRESDGRHERISALSGAVVPLAAKTPAWDSKDYADALCTRRSDVLEVTYVPLPELPRRLRKPKLEAAIGDAGDGADFADAAPAAADAPAGGAGGDSAAKGKDGGP